MQDDGVREVGRCRLWRNQIHRGNAVVVAPEVKQVFAVHLNPLQRLATDGCSPCAHQETHHIFCEPCRASEHPRRICMYRPAAMSPYGVPSAAPHMHCTSPSVKRALGDAATNFFFSSILRWTCPTRWH